MSDEYRELREKAEAATPGPWECRVELVWASDKLGDILVAIAQLGDDAEADAEFIAAANPTTVLALLEERDALRAAAEAYIEVMSDHAQADGDSYCWSCGMDWPCEASRIRDAAALALPRGGE